MKRKMIIISSIIILLTLVSCSYSNSESIPNASFMNLEPSIFMNDFEYIIDMEEELNIEDIIIGDKIAHVNQVVEIVSYLDKSNPYKNIGDIYALSGEDNPIKVVIQINGKFYPAIRRSY